MVNDILWSICVQTNSARFDSFPIFTLPAFFLYVCVRVTAMCLLSTAKTFNHYINICDASKQPNEVLANKRNKKEFEKKSEQASQ